MEIKLSELIYVVSALLVMLTAESWVLFLLITMLYYAYEWGWK